MPKRTNEFQQLIHMIERQLAPKGATVTESKIVPDSVTGIGREVDIAIEMKVGVHELLVAIECRDWKRKVDIKWIDEIMGKYQNLPAKVIAVSRSGFTKTALEKASKVGIEALTLEEAQSTDWESVVHKIGNISMESFLAPYLTKVVIIIDEAHRSILEDIESQSMDLSRWDLHDSDNISFGNISTIANNYLSAPELIEKARELAFTDSGTILEFEIPFKEGCHITSDELPGAEIPVWGIQVHAKCNRELASINLANESYGSAQVASGSGETFGRPLSMVFTQAEDEQARIGIRIKGIKVKKSED